MSETMGTWDCLVQCVVPGEPGASVGYLMRVEAKDMAGARRAAVERMWSNAPHIASLGLVMSDPEQVTFMPDLSGPGVPRF